MRYLYAILNNPTQATQGDKPSGREVARTGREDTMNTQTTGFAWAIGCLALSASLLAQAAEPIVFGVPEQESFPNIMGNGVVVEPPGIYLDMMRRLGAEHGLEARFVRLPTRRLLLALCDGSIDVAVEFSYLPERTECARYPMKGDVPDSKRRLDSLSYHLYTKEGTQVTWDGVRFNNVDGRLGANVGFSIVAHLETMGMKVETAPDTDNNLAKLDAGRISGYVQLSTKADEILLLNKTLRITKQPIPVRTTDYYIIFSQRYYAKHPERVERLWTRLGEIRDDSIKTLTPRYMQMRLAK
jgi:polar amino acid transport system substrate-binding protein